MSISNLVPEILPEGVLKRAHRPRSLWYVRFNHTLLMSLQVFWYLDSLGVSIH